MKQTAVEWLYEAIDNELIDFLDNRTDLNELSVAMLKAKREALRMEKDQIMDAYSSGRFNYEDWTKNIKKHIIQSEQYYNEAYKKPKQ